MEVSKEQKKCNDRWTVAEVLGALSILALMGGFVQHLVKGTEDRVINAIEKTETKIERVENKLDEHIQFHLRLPNKCYSEDIKEVSYARENKRKSGETSRPEKGREVGERIR
jgi:ribosomal protein L14E/L6E/L27E